MTEGQQRIRVLFVDDDPAGLAQMSTASNGRQASWDARVAKTAQGALAALEFSEPFDVIVTALRMPHMDGAALLSTVRSRYPAMVRIVVSDFRDVSSALRTIPVAHQFLGSPLEPAGLANAIDRCVELQHQLASPALRRMLGEMDLLPTPTASVIELNRALSHPDVEIDDVARVIETDPAMTAKLLQLVNSAFFGLGHRVTDTRHAVSYLGLSTVRSLLTAIELVRAFVPPNQDLVQAVEEIHTHSLAVAELSRSLMLHRHQVHDAFAAGMMHDVGLLAVVSCMPSRYLALRDEMRADGRTIEECEVEVLGARHAHLGAYLLNLWGLPYSLVEAVARSHDADSMSCPSLTPTHAVFVAEQVVNMSAVPGTWEGGRIPDHEYLNALGIADVVTEMVGRP